MSFNGSGSFLINSAGQPVVSGTVISSTAFNALTADLATGLSTCITKDGQTTVTANIPMANYKFTGLGAGSAAADSANLSQVQSTVVKLLASVSGTDTITAVGSPTVAAYAAGQMFYFVAAGDNTGAVTLNIDSLGAKNVTRDGSVALAAGDIKSGEVVVIVYDGTRFQVVSQLNSSGDARFANVSIASALNVGGVATFSAGTVAAPAITTTGDTNTGIFFPAADTIAFAEGGVEAMRINSSANVGIGTSSPQSKLDVFAASSGGGGTVRISGNTDAAYGELIFSSSNATYAAYGASISSEGTGGVDGGILKFNTGAGAVRAEKMRLDGSGNLGLGVTPSAWGSGYSAIDLGFGGGIFADTASFSAVQVASNTYWNSSYKYKRSSQGASSYVQFDGVHSWYTAASGTAGNNITFGDAKMVLNASGNLGVGTTSPTQKLQVGGAITCERFQLSGNTSAPSGTDAFIFRPADNVLAFGTNGTERARITASGVLLSGKTSDDDTVKGIAINGPAGELKATNTDSTVVIINRQTNDGTLVSLRQANAEEGSISVSGNTVSYNAFAGSHWSQLQDGSKPDILRGTVMESINELCVWPGEQNERLPKSKVSDTAGSKKVYGVFMAWDNDWTTTNDMYVTAVGAFICRVNGSVTVQEGDLLESNGDGTARVQADDIIRSSTIGKVTSTVKTHEYDDGSYCVPTVLYCG